MKLRFALLVLVLALSCESAPRHLTPDPSLEDCFPTNPEVLSYLEGKPLPLDQAIPASKRRPWDRAINIKLEGITALSVATNGKRSGDGLWATTVTFMYDTGRARYRIEMIARHERIGERRVFHDHVLKRLIRL